MANKIKYLVIHCSDTPTGRSVTKKDIEQWHLVENGWSRLGYTDLIDIDGKLINLTSYNQDDIIDTHEMTWGAKGINSISRHVCYAGGKGGDTRTQAQKVTLSQYVKFMVLRHPGIIIIGHNQVSYKDCPSFDVPEWLQSIGINTKNIMN